MTGLTKEQRRTLHVLAYMMLRMGQQARAGRIYAALAALAPQTEPDRQALAGLAALAIEAGQGAKALEYLRVVMGGRALSSRHAVFHLMKAQALWLEGRREEARAALDEYLFLAGGGKNA